MGESVERTESDRGRHEEKGGVREMSKESDGTHVTGKNREILEGRGYVGLETRRWGGNRK